jgi:hypothetical protein
MAHVAEDEDMSCFGRLSHAADAMKYITNQDVGDNADAWHDWWAKNNSKSQIEWLADGFRQRGLDVDVPPSAEQMSALLELLGNSRTDESEGAPEHLKYNAFRCLRESGFEPVQYAISQRSLSEEIERGLLEYARLNARWPAATTWAFSLSGSPGVTGNLPSGSFRQCSRISIGWPLTP